MSPRKDQLRITLSDRQSEWLTTMSDPTSPEPSDLLIEAEALGARWSTELLYLPNRDACRALTAALRCWEVIYAESSDPYERTSLLRTISTLVVRVEAAESAQYLPSNRVAA